MAINSDTKLFRDIIYGLKFVGDNFAKLLGGLAGFLDRSLLRYPLRTMMMHRFQ